MNQRTQSRKVRGRRTQEVVARWFRCSGWPHAESTGAGRPGEDITGLGPFLRIEVKARRGFRPWEWLRQAGGQATEGVPIVPIVVFRPDGAGETTVPRWGALVTLETMTWLLDQAGYCPGTVPWAQGHREPDEALAPPGGNEWLYLNRRGGSNGST